MHLTVVLVEPLYSENIGLIARAMKNFNVSDLRLVNCKNLHLNVKAKSRAMHALDVLLNAKTFSSLKSALKDADISIATTSKITKAVKHYRKALNVKQLAMLYGGTDTKLALVFGRENTGLTNEELLDCDLIASIPASNAYKTLNLSHAVAVMLYEFFNARKKARLSIANKKTRMQALKLFNSITLNLKGIKNKRAVSYAFKQLISRTNVTEKELKAIIAVLSKTRIELEARHKKY